MPAIPPAGAPSRIHLLAPAKLNLHLEGLRKREDGYHEIETILQAVDLHDRLDVSWLERWRGRPPRVDLSVDPYDAAPEGEENLCCRALDVFYRETGTSGRFRIGLHKEIPVGAGLGGGSSDAAAVLVACDRLAGTCLSAAELEDLGARIGSDVPFFIRGGTQLGRGRGTDLKRLPSLQGGEFLIVIPDMALQTSNIYRRLNMGLTTRSPKVNIRHIEALIARFPRGSWFGGNRLEDVVIPGYPVLQRLLEVLHEHASIAMLSGSGAAVFAVFSDHGRLEQARQEVERPDWFVRVVKPQAAGVIVREDV
ncbi:4-(cytidine 5'-diphospho)-2-C-methyl-D-erythritol kinase [bacterium]|nr:4-(cytidine 5'-diphospho)-2-C-methyl-D-erythritol kinase [bacterium]